MSEEEKITFNQLRMKLKQLDIAELRFDLDDYVEFVIQMDMVAQVKIILELYFGGAVNLDKEDEDQQVQEAVEFVQTKGGIRQNQTLFYRPRNGLKEYAMVWPWCDGSKVSIRLAQHRLFE